MSSSEIDITVLIVCICVIVPAVIAISICVIIYCAHRHKDLKIPQQTNRSSFYEYEETRERPSQGTYIIDFTHVNHTQQQCRPHRPAPVIEQSPPSYYMSVKPTRRQPVPLFSTIHTTPSSINVHRSSPIITSSVYSSMPPSYAEIFLSS